MSGATKAQYISELSKDVATLSNSLVNNWNTDDHLQPAFWIKDKLLEGEICPSINAVNIKGPTILNNKRNLIHNNSFIKIRETNLERIKEGAKCINLSLGRKCLLPSNPKYVCVDEYQNKIKSENEAVESKMNLYNKDGYCSLYQDGANIALSVFQHAGEMFYKMFRGREGHMKGEDKCIYIALSSFAMYVIASHPIRKEMLQEKILYEDIQHIFLGTNERWIAIVKRPGKENENWIQFELGDSQSTKDLVKFLECAIRRRAIFSFRLKLENVNHLPANNSNLNLLLASSNYEETYQSQLKKLVLSRRKSFSIGQFLEPLLPSVITCSSQEKEYIESWLANLHKFKTKPKVLACWLVFWENGSISSEEPDIHLEPSPSLEGFLMVNNNYQLTSWIPAYFILKCGMLYQFHDLYDQLPHCLIEMNDCCGCLRLPSDTRPHAFQLLRENDPPLQLAAPNEEIASQWLQTFIKLLGTKGEEQNKRRLQPCQLIQTTAGLALTYQSNIINFCQPASVTKSTSHSVPRKKNVNSKLESPSTPNRPNVIQKVNVNFQKNSIVLVSDGIPCKLARKTCMMSPAKSNQRESTSSPKYQKKTREVNMDSNSVRASLRNDVDDPASSVEKNLEEDPFDVRCPPTPPLPKCFPLENEGNKNYQRENSALHAESLQLLSFCNLDQISEVFVTAFKSNACLLEFECSEACEIVGDWALYFHSEDHLHSFLSTIVESRKLLGEDDLPITPVSKGLTYELLREGSALSKSMWLKKC